MNVMRESLQSIQAYSKDKAFQLQDYQNIASLTHAIPYATLSISWTVTLNVIQSYTGWKFNLII